MRLTKRDIVDWLDRTYHKSAVVDLVQYLRDEMGYDLDPNQPKGEMLDALLDGGPQKSRLLEAIAEVLDMDENEIEVDLFNEALDDEGDAAEDGGDEGDDEDSKDSDDEEGEEEDYWRTSRVEDSKVFEFDPEKAGLPARPYQEQLVEAIGRAYRELGAGHRSLVHVATGGGKTRIANDWAWKLIADGARRILWVTKDWQLLRQAATDMCQRYRNAGEKMGRPDCLAATKMLSPIAQDTDRQLVYTTIHTWRRRHSSEGFRGRNAFDAVIVDELHWGEKKPMYKRLLGKYGEAAFFLGLTATPHDDTSFELIDPSFPFKSLVDMAVLATPRSERQETHIAWRPSMRVGDFARGDLGELARSKPRNRLVVDRYCKERHRYGKTLVFACDIEHACSLGQLFRDKGIPVEVIHSDLDFGERKVAHDKFLKGKVDVLVNVAMYIYGVDVPDIESVFMARPTASPILFSQMVGRGARRTEGKSSFHIVDFVDNLLAYGNRLVTGDELFGVIREPQTSAPRLPGPRRQRHEYHPSHIERYRGDMEELDGLELQPEQTFGIEFELTRAGTQPGDEQPDDWRQVALSLMAELKPKVRSIAERPLDVHGTVEKDDSVWNVEWDSSCGWEATTRILSGPEGFEEVAAGLAGLERAVDANGLKVNRRTGTHIHLAWDRSQDIARKLERIFSLAAYYEPAFMSLVAPSRAGNEYCRSVQLVAANWDLMLVLEGAEARYLWLNAQNLQSGGLGTLEVRLHNGTWEAQKILTWTSLWMRVVEAIDRDADFGLPEFFGIHREPLATGRRGDILDLAERLSAGPPLKKRLAARRETVFENSWASHPDYGELARGVHRHWHS